MASMTEDSVRPAWRSPGHDGDHASTGCPSSASCFMARARGAALPPWAETITTPEKSTAAERPNSRRRS